MPQSVNVWIQQEDFFVVSLYKHFTLAVSLFTKNKMVCGESLLRPDRSFYCSLTGARDGGGGGGGSPIFQVTLCLFKPRNH